MHRWWRRRWVLALVLGLTASLGALSLVFGFEEEGRLWFIDPDDGQPYYAEYVSTVHDDLVGALAVCAGFNPPAVNTLQVYSQLVDSNKLAGGKYSLCGRPQPTPPPSTQACGGQTLDRTWPRQDTNLEAAGCFASLYGPYAPFFHFAHDNSSELGAIRAWALGETPTLRGKAAFAWGGDILNPVINATCTARPEADVDTGGIAAGSTVAFAVYLHAVADHWANRDCIAQLDAAGEPWGTHTNDPRFPACSTNGSLNDFGPADTDTNRTEQGILAIYREMIDRSRNRAEETLYYPIPLDAHEAHLQGAIAEFVHTWPSLDQSGQQNYPTLRREKAAEIRQWCAETRRTDTVYARVRWFAYLPALVKRALLGQ